MATTGAKQEEEIPENMKTLKHGGQFVCQWERFRRPGLLDLTKWRFCTPNNSNIPSDEKELDRTLPVLQVSPEQLANPPENKIQVTWIGHATVYVQFDGISILTDPVLGEYCGPDAWLLKMFRHKRYRKAACKIDDIPRLDAVIISHDHNDHLDKQTVETIVKKHGNVRWFVPAGSTALLSEWGCENVTERIWWEESQFSVADQEFRFICTPTQHWCQRSACDMNKRLWCSWVVKGPKKSFYFAGDTGYYKELFQTIGKKYGPFDLAAIPIGAYEPRFITRYQHVDPEEAVNVYEDLGRPQTLAIHWGTFELTNEFYLEPPRKVQKLLKERSLDPNSIASLHHGETWIVGEQRKHSQFMED